MRDEDFFVLSMIAMLAAVILLAKDCQHDACIDNCSTRKFASADEARVCFVSCRQGVTQ